ncbi:MAG: hypothetical protein IKX96_04825 [Firmicutes bacterium]|nr:hypothetical protein [Bacillota bacterium]MBR5926653.1 hypothetical protein [Bacillota bacterium]
MEYGDNEIRSVENDIVNLSLQIGLFLDAGLVVSSAFEELTELNALNPRPLYAALRFIQKESREKNLSFAGQLFLFAQKIRSKALMRFSLLILDNQSKGSTLSDKLERERTQMQSDSLNRAKALAKQAETKLCFPLMLLLVALIVVCSAPALMQM